MSAKINIGLSVGIMILFLITIGIGYFYVTETRDLAWKAGLQSAQNSKDINFTRTLVNDVRATLEERGDQHDDMADILIGLNGTQDQILFLTNNTITGREQAVSNLSMQHKEIIAMIKQILNNTRE